MKPNRVLRGMAAARISAQEDTPPPRHAGCGWGVWL
jgi:hypothetical protein